MNGAGAGTELRTVAFGGLDADIWGAAWSCGANGHGHAMVSIGAGSGVFEGQVAIDGYGEAQPWQLSAPGVELVITPQGAPAIAAAASIDEAPTTGCEQLCGVRGALVIDGAEHDVQCPGLRGARTIEVTLARLESVREVFAWFGPGDGLGLLALRPLGSAGHEHDRVAAALFEGGGAVPVTDPRLSTTYGASGLPTRASIELWLQAHEGEAFPRRAVGEVSGPWGKMTAAQDERPGPTIVVSCAPLRWRSKGREGAGVYLLAALG